MKITKYFLLMACAIIGFSMSAIAQTEDLPYDSGSQGEDGPLSFAKPLSGQPVEDSARFAFAGDSNRNEVVVFGGYDASWNFSSATWVWSKEAGWEEKFPQNSPPARINAVMGYDAERKQIVLFGGWGQNGYLNDTWVWDGSDWQQKSPTFSPTEYWSRKNMVYDPVHKGLLLLQRNNISASSITMHLWDGEEWIDKTPQNSTGPNDYNAYDFGAAYDAKNNQLVYLDSSSTWIFDGTDWEQKNTIARPSGWDFRGKLAYDTNTQSVLFFGGISNQSYGNETWAWTGTDWKKLEVEAAPEPMAYHSLAQIGNGVVVFGGHFDGTYNYWEQTGQIMMASTQYWDGVKWNYSSGVFEFDMSKKDDGVWRYSTITIPRGMVVRFKKNKTNTPVSWLASGDVKIDGVLELSGENGGYYSKQVYWSGQIYEYFSRPKGYVAKAGPGGFHGGAGGVRFTESGSYAGMPGVGPGGGASGTTNDNSPSSFGKAGGFTGSANASGQIQAIYGNTYLQPLVGGSGGGGSASKDDADGVSGGGGGGGILIASTRDITINGAILANGGGAGNSYLYIYPYSYTNTYSGPGSGGAIRLVGDRVLGSGHLSAVGGIGYSYHDGGVSINSNQASTGRIRIEGFERELAHSNKINPPAFRAPPLVGVSPIKSLGSLRVESVAGQNVTQPATGSLETPDVVFDAAGSVKIIVAGENIPDGTRIKVRITMKGRAVESEPVSLTNGQAEFNLSVPAGEGTIQAYSLRSLTYKDEAEENGQPQS